MRTHATPEELARVRAEQIAENEDVDAAIEVVARHLLIAEAEMQINWKPTRQDSGLPDLRWRQVKDRIDYLMAEMRPSDVEYRDALRKLLDVS